jgi:hypothetical protein
MKELAFKQSLPQKGKEIKIKTIELVSLFT